MPEGGGHPVGVEWTGIMSIGEIFGVVGGSCCSDMIFSNFRKLFSNISSFSLVLGPVRGHPLKLIPITKSDVPAPASAPAFYIPPHHRRIQEESR